MHFFNIFRPSFGGKILSLIIVASILSSACGGKKNANANANTVQNEANATAPILVTTTRVESKEVPAFVQANGSLLADETSDVASQVSGQVITTPVNIGDFVRQGDVLAQLDDKNARLQLSQNQANVAQAEANVRQAQARLGLGANSSFEANQIPEVRAAQANYEQLLAEQKLAEANEERYRDLVKTGDVAMVLYDQYRTAKDTAVARTNNARQQLAAARNTAGENNQAIKSAQAAVESAKSQIAVAQKAIADATIRAPFSGFISARPIAIGENVSPTSIIATILRSNPIKAQLRVDEGEVPNIKIGTGVSLTVRAYADRRFSGTVTAINPALDEASRAATVEALIENGDNALRSGMFATARIIRAGGNMGVFVPKSAVYADNTTQSYRVFVIQEGLAKLRVVQLGQEENDNYQILSGINADETVATSNVDKLFEGAKVQIGQ
jgi:multidrug efflux pump subunit AcrA (membrane-fusion protein)